MKLKLKRLLIVVLSIQIIVLVYIGVRIANFDNGGAIMSPPIFAWESRYTEYSESGWSISGLDESEDNKEIDLIYGPFMALTRGCYSISIDYIAEEDQKYDVYSYNDNSSIVRHESQNLSNYENTVTEHFTVLKDLNDFEVRVKYTGNGEFQIKNIQIVPSSFIYRELFVYFALFFALIDMFVISICGYKNIDGRKIWIDVVKGIGILLVLIGHENPPFKWLIFGFHMPLFFIIAGYLYNEDVETTAYIRKLFKRYIVPYFVMRLINLVILCIRMKELTISHIIEQLGDIVYSGEQAVGTPLWFLTSLFCCLLILHLVHRVNDYCHRTLIIVALTVFSICTQVENVPRLPWSLGEALVGVMFAECGFLIKKYQLVERLSNSRVIDRIGCIMLMIVCGYRASKMNTDYFGKGVSMHDRRYNCAPLMIIGAILLSLALMSIVYEVCNVSKNKMTYAVAQLGRNTMIIFGFDFAAGDVGGDIFKLLLGNYYTWYLMSIFKLVILVSICYVWTKISSRIRNDVSNI